MTPFDRRLLKLALFALALPFGALACTLVETPEDDAGSAGSSGSAGNAGSAGSAGNAGSAGSSNSGGAGGTAGSGGSQGGGGNGGSGAAGSGGNDGGGGSGGQNIAPPYASGSRLAVRARTGDGGASVFVGWRDTQNGADCLFRHNPDGSIRCLPDMGKAASFMFLDASCTELIAVRACGSQANLFSVQSGEAGCEEGSEPFEVYEMGAVVNPNTTYALLGNTCIPFDPPDGVELHEVAKISADGFVSATMSEEMRGDRLAVRVLVGADGSREARAMRDTQLATNCEARATAPDELRCMPAVTGVSAGSFFEDQGCTTPLLANTNSKPGCPDPLFALQPSNMFTCHPTVSTLHVGALVDPPTVYEGSPAQCSQVPFMPGGWSYYTEGSPIQTATIEKLLTVPIGTGRLRAPRYTTEAGDELAPLGSFFDDERGRDCIVRPFVDGSLRCVPDDVKPTKFFKDGQCKVPLVTVDAEPGCPLPPPPEAIVVSKPSDPKCGEDPIVQKVYAVGAPYTQPTVHMKVGNNCNSLQTSQLGMDVYLTGAELQSDIYALVTETP